MKKRIMALAALPVLLLTAGCGGNGWTANPVDNPEGCYQIERWESDGFRTLTWAEGIYCPAKVVPSE